jgi:hypothetical protein
MIGHYIKKILLGIIVIALLVGGGYFAYKKLYQEPQQQAEIQQQQKLAKKEQKRQAKEQKARLRKEEQEKTRQKVQAQKKAREEAERKRKEKELAEQSKENKPDPMETLKKMFEPSKEPPPYAYHAPSTINEKLTDYYYADELIDWYNKALKNPTKENNALFYGAPGTGKTSLARILAKNAGKPFFEVKGDDLYAQQHEKREPRDKVLALLMDIEQGKFGGLKGGKQDIDISNGYILFIDEANTMEKEAVPKGRKLGFLKTVYDAFDKHQENKKVLTILATNYLDDLDKGLFRAGRFPKLCFNFSLPLMWRIMEKEGIDYDVILLKSMPRIDTAGAKTAPLIAELGIDKLRKFMQFWAKGQLSRKFSAQEKQFKYQFRKSLELFWKLEQSGQLDSYLRRKTVPKPPWEEEGSSSEEEKKKNK